MDGIFIALHDYRNSGSDVTGMMCLYINPNDLTGTIPGSWATEMLSNLQEIWLSMNTLTGTLPVSSPH
jgi:hypothetical protein